MEALNFFKFPGLCGFGILLDGRLKQNKTALFEFFNGFDFSILIRKYFDLIEGLRIDTEFLLSEKNSEIQLVKQKKKAEITTLQEQYRRLEAAHAEKRIRSSMQNGSHGVVAQGRDQTVESSAKQQG